MTKPASDLFDVDIEKQESVEKPDTPSDGNTTLADETLTTPDSPTTTKLGRRWTDRLKSSIRTPSFPLPTVWKPAQYDETDENIERIDRHPNGYPRLAAYINSDDNFMMCRRYGLLHTRVLLYRQDELRELEDRLLRLDSEDAECPSTTNLLKSRKLDDATEGSLRRGLIQEIDDKLKEYDALVIRCRDLASLRRTSSRDHTSLSNWMFNEKPLSREESEFIQAKEDFIALAEQPEGSWFDACIEDVLTKIPCKLTRLLFTTADQRRKSADPHISYYAKSRIDVLVRMVVCLLAVLLLVAPVALLFVCQESNGLKLLILLAFTMVFCVCVSTFTRARRHEVFAATAAYTAVLVVFLGNYVPGLSSAHG